MKKTRKFKMLTEKEFDQIHILNDMDLNNKQIMAITDRSTATIRRVLESKNLQDYRDKSAAERRQYGYVPKGDTPTPEPTATEECKQLITILNNINTSLLEIKKGS